jgi:hypothetical protein
MKAYLGRKHEQIKEMWVSPKELFLEHGFVGWVGRWLGEVLESLLLERLHCLGHRGLEQIDSDISHGHV